MTSSKRAKKKTKSISKTGFSAALGHEQLTALAHELHNLRSHPPLVRRTDGKYEGDILGFVKGLRLSARLIYFLRERLSPHTQLEISWGCLLNNDSLSPECDVIVHSKGHHREWNGHKTSVMEFKFIQAVNARVVISCKSQLRAIDQRYPKDLKKYGVHKVFLFAECCREKSFQRLRETALKAGYTDLCCLYFTGSEPSFYKSDEKLYVAFGDAILKAVQ